MIAEPIEPARPPLPPFAEDAWHSRGPDRVAAACTPDSRWRNRAEFFAGREAIAAFPQRKWRRELDCRLIKEVWAFNENRIAVRFAYEWHDDSGNWHPSHGNEQSAFAGDGRVARREASINDVAIAEADCLFRWPPGPRPADHPELTELGL